LPPPFQVAVLVLMVCLFSFASEKIFNFFFGVADSLIL
jgi:hypothetical protein